MDSSAVSRDIITHAPPSHRPKKSSETFGKAAKEAKKSTSTCEGLLYQVFGQVMVSDESVGQSIEHRKI